MTNNQESEYLSIGISSRVLFNLDESHQIFQQQGLEAFQAHQIAKENEVLERGVAFQLVAKLLKLNQDGKRRIEVMLISRNSSDTGLRIFNSIEHYQLPISRAVFCSGRDPFKYAKPFACQLFLSAEEDDVRAALASGLAAARIINAHRPAPPHQIQDQEVRIAFDGDSVLFSDEAEQIYQNQGLDAFQQNETRQSHNALPGGPFKAFLAALYHLQQGYPTDACPIRTALVTARSAPAHKRVILTLREWNIRLDECFFLGGLTKKQFLETFGADIFFEDQQLHCKTASESVTTGHVPFGITNSTAD